MAVPPIASSSSLLPPRFHPRPPPSSHSVITSLVFKHSSPPLRMLIPLHTPIILSTCLTPTITTLHPLASLDSMILSCACVCHTVDGVVGSLLLGLGEPAVHRCWEVVGVVVMRFVMVLVGGGCGDRARGRILVVEVGAGGGGGVEMSVVGGLGPGSGDGAVCFELKVVSSDWG